MLLCYKDLEKPYFTRVYGITKCITKWFLILLCYEFLLYSRFLLKNSFCYKTVFVMVFVMVFVVTFS